MSVSKPDPIWWNPVYNCWMVTGYSEVFVTREEAEAFKEEQDGWNRLSDRICQRCGRRSDEPLVASVQQEQVCPDCLRHLSQPKVAQRIANCRENDRIRRYRGN